VGATFVIDKSGTTFTVPAGGWTTVKFGSIFVAGCAGTTVTEFQDACNTNIAANQFQSIGLVSQCLTGLMDALAFAKLRAGANPPSGDQYVLDVLSITTVCNAALLQGSLTLAGNYLAQFIDEINSETCFISSSCVYQSGNHYN